MRLVKLVTFEPRRYRMSEVGSAVTISSAEVGRVQKGRHVEVAESGTACVASERRYSRDLRDIGWLGKGVDGWRGINKKTGR